MRRIALPCFVVLLRLWSWGVAQAEPPDANQRRGLRCISTSGFITVRTASGSFSFQPVDLRRGPLLVTDGGLFIRCLSTPSDEPPPVAGQQAILPAADLLKDKRDEPDKAPGWGQAPPVVYANPADRPLKLLNGAMVVPPRTVAVHPGADRDAALSTCLDPADQRT